MTAPNPLDQQRDKPQENKLSKDVPAVQPAKGVHVTPPYVATEVNRTVVLGDGVTVRQDN